MAGFTELNDVNALTFLAVAPIAAICIDAEGLIVFANDAASALFAAQGPLDGMRAASLISEIDCMIANPPVAGFLETRIACGGVVKAVELKLATWNGGSGRLTGVLLRDIDLEKRTVIMHTELRRRAEAALAEAEAARQRLGFIIDMLPQATCVFDAEDRYVLWNEKYAALYPEIAAHLRPGMPFIDILRLSLASGDMPEVVDDPEEWLRRRMQRHALPVSHEEQHLRDGRWLLHDERRTPDGGAIGMRIDITELKHREASLRLLFDANPTPMLLCDAASFAIQAANESTARLSGVSRDNLLAMFAPSLFVEEDAGKLRDALEALKDDADGRTIWRLKAPDGERHVLLYVRFLADGEARQLLLTIADVTERVRAEAHAMHLAHHDGLTGLPNRSHFRNRLQEALEHMHAAGTDLAVHYIDLDGFKPVNDTFGHSAGDELLKLVAERLRLAMPEGDMVARLGGDEFAVLQKGTSRHVESAKRCIEVLQIPFLVVGQAVRISASVGIALAPRDGVEADELMMAADQALYRAKVEGRNTWRLSLRAMA